MLCICSEFSHERAKGLFIILRTSSRKRGKVTLTLFSIPVIHKHMRIIVCFLYTSLGWSAVPHRLPAVQYITIQIAIMPHVLINVIKNNKKSTKYTCPETGRKCVLI